jgi:tRNA G10  N-methylase Trm11
MQYLVRFAQMHESFRQAETDSLAELNGLQLEWISYSDEVGVSCSHRCRASHVILRRPWSLHLVWSVTKATGPSMGFGQMRSIVDVQRSANGRPSLDPVCYYTVARGG